MTLSPPSNEFVLIYPIGGDCVLLDRFSADYEDLREQIFRLDCFHVEISDGVVFPQSQLQYLGL